MKGEAIRFVLRIQSNVYRAQQREGGKPAEFEQIGVECIGDGTISADGEVIALMIAALKRAGLTNFKIAIGHIGFVNALLLILSEMKSVPIYLEGFYMRKIMWLS